MSISISSNGGLNDWNSWFNCPAENKKVCCRSSQSMIQLKNK